MKTAFVICGFILCCGLALGQTGTDSPPKFTVSFEVAAPKQRTVECKRLSISPTARSWSALLTINLQLPPQSAQIDPVFPVYRRKDDNSIVYVPYLTATSKRVRLESRTRAFGGKLYSSPGLAVMEFPRLAATELTDFAEALDRSAANRAQVSFTATIFKVSGTRQSGSEKVTAGDIIEALYSGLDLNKNPSLLGRRLAALSKRPAAFQTLESGYTRLSAKAIWQGGVDLAMAREAISRSYLLATQVRTSGHGSLSETTASVIRQVTGRRFCPKQ